MLAAPLGTIAINAAKKIGQALAKEAVIDPEKLIKRVLLIIIIILFVFVIFFSVPIIMIMFIPFTGADQAMEYKEITADVSESTSSPCDDGVTIDWRKVLAVHAVQNKQSFFGIGVDDIEGTAKKFLKKDGTCTHCTGSGNNRT